MDLVLQYREGLCLDEVDERVNIVELNRRVRYGLRRHLRYLRRRSPRALLTIQTELNVLGIIAWRLSGLSTNRKSAQVERGVSVETLCGSRQAVASSSF